MEEFAPLWRIVIDEGQTVWPPYVQEKRYATAEHARAAALRFARKHVPENPWFERDRTIIKCGEDMFLVTVYGASSVGHFRVSAGCEVE